jgi:hypothetical protein
MRPIRLTLTAREGELFINPEAIEAFHEAMVYQDAEYKVGSTVRVRSGIQYDVTESPEEIQRLMEAS